MKVILSLLLAIIGVEVYAQSVKMPEPYIYYEISGYYQDKLGGGGSPRKLFDGLATHDPKNNGATTGDNAGGGTYPWPFRGGGYDKFGSLMPFVKDFPGRQGMLCWFDMTGDNDRLKTHGAKWNITDIYFFGLDDYQDTLFLYNGDKVIEAPVANRPAMLARPDSLLTPFAILVPGNTPISNQSHWRFVGSITDSMRYIIMRTKYIDRGSYQTLPGISEIVMYGSKRFTDASINLRKRWFDYTGPLPTAKHIGVRMGANNYGVDSTAGKYDWWHRYYQIMKQYDDQNVAWPANQFNKNSFSTNQTSFVAAWQAAKARGETPLTSVTGSNTYNESTFGISPNQGLMVTVPGMDPRLPQSWKRGADIFRHLAALYMDTTKKKAGVIINNGSLRYYNGAAFPGLSLGVWPGIEPGNEDEARYEAVDVQVARLNAYWDLWEGRLADANVPYGYHDVDTTAWFMQPGQVYAEDTGRLRNLIFYFELTRTDRKVPFKYFNGHHYPASINELDHGPTLDEQVGATGVRPERDHVYERARARTLFMYNELDGDTTYRDALTEYGYENWATPSTSAAQISYGAPYFVYWSYRFTPIIPGYDSLQSKGINMVRSELLLSFVPGLDVFTEFSLVNPGYNMSNSTPAINGSTGRGGHNSALGGANSEMNVKFANYWTTASYRTILKNYIPVGIPTIDSLGLCMGKFRHRTLVDSVCYVIWKGSGNGTSIGGLSLNVGSVVGNANKWSLSFSSVTGATTTQAVNTGVMSYTATEEPKFYFLKEVLPPTTAPGFILKFNKASISKER